MVESYVAFKVRFVCAQVCRVGVSGDTGLSFNTGLSGDGPGKMRVKRRDFVTSKTIVLTRSFSGPTGTSACVNGHYFVNMGTVVVYKMGIGSGMVIKDKSIIAGSVPTGYVMTNGPTEVVGRNVRAGGFKRLVRRS